jgi:hypothetical protein
VQQWADFSGEAATTAIRHHQLELKPDQVKPGQTVLLRAVACDRRAINDWGLELKPQEGASGWCAVKIVTEEAKATTALEQLESLRSAVWKILDKQVQSRTLAGNLSPKRPIADLTAAAASLRPQQIEIQKLSTDLVQSIGKSDHEERLAIRRVLNALAFGDMLKAVAQCDAMANLKTLDAFKKPASELIASQDHIIATLRKLLDVTRQAESEALSQMKKRSGGNLPDDVRQKFQAMRDKLDKFLEQQKKIIEASESLAKTPAEDFTKAQAEALKGMAAAEDDWSKFMKEMHNDLSKLPDQDFANASTLKELSEIQTELKMAEDALVKKSSDIAVPLEQLGYEHAEDAKTNIEKWLTDTPSREKWSQEESPTDKDKEAPMSELPGELEDIVGDLMEQEEDLFDEMENVTSSAAESADRGAGWDATDGPISNMSAKGVTGNRLPSTSEIGGRSGEGRQGKRTANSSVTRPSARAAAKHPAV